MIYDCKERSVKQVLFSARPLKCREKRNHVLFPTVVKCFFVLIYYILSRVSLYCQLYTIYKNKRSSNVKLIRPVWKKCSSPLYMFKRNDKKNNFGKKVIAQHNQFCVHRKAKLGNQSVLPTQYFSITQVFEIFIT